MKIIRKLRRVIRTASNPYWLEAEMIRARKAKDFALGVNNMEEAKFQKEIEKLILWRLGRIFAIQLCSLAQKRKAIIKGATKKEKKLCDALVSLINQVEKYEKSKTKDDDCAEHNLRYAVIRAREVLFNMDQTPVSEVTNKESEVTNA